MKSDITVYTLPICPNCDELKTKLRNAGIEFVFKDLEDYDNYSELLLSQVTFTEAPIVKIGDMFYDKIGAEECLKLT